MSPQPQPGTQPTLQAPAAAARSTPTSPTASPSIPSAPPPSRAEVERKLSFKSAPRSRSNDAPRRPKVATGNGNESDSSVASSTHPSLITSPISVAAQGGPATASPVTITPSNASPVVGGHGSTLPHSNLSAIAEQGSKAGLVPAPRRKGSLFSGIGEDTLPELDELEGVDEEGGEDDSDGADDDDTNPGGGEDKTDLTRGMEGERVFKSGFLIKKQERRKQWKKKWFVLRATKLAYYKDNREYSLSRAIDLRQVHSCVPISSGEKQKHPFAFAIVTSDRTFLVEALSNEEREDWVKAINSVRKRMTDREDEANRRRDPSATRAVAVPARPGATAAAAHDELVEPHQGTWTSTFSSTTASTSPARSQSGSYFHHIVHPQNPASAAPPHAHVAASSSISSTLSAQLATLSTGAAVGGVVGAASNGAGAAGVARTPSINAPGPSTAGPSAASVTRRLSHPIPVPTVQTSRLGLAGGPTSPTNANLSPPNATPHLGASSDEDEAYFSDPHTAWADLIATSPPTTTVADPNKVILATYLMKRSRKTAREVWRKRWFFLTSAGITYTKSHMDNRVLTFIGIPSILDVFSLEDADDDGAFDSSGAEDGGNFRHPSLRTKRDPVAPPKNIEHVIRIVTSKRRYDLCVPSEEEEIKWIAAIRALVNRERERQAAGTAQPPMSPLTETAPALKAAATHHPVPIIAQQPPTPGSQASPLLGGNIPQVPTVPQPAPAVASTTHTRSRSATQVAKNAVAEATRKYVEVGKQ